MTLGFYFFDPRLFDGAYWLLIGPTILIALWAQFKVKSAYGTYTRKPNASGITGAEAAARILQQEGAHDVQIEMTPGTLSDHYDPRSKVLRLSPEVYSGRSVAAIGIAAHEAGHALQDAHGYALLGIRSLMAPASMLSNLFLPMFLIGLYLQVAGLIMLGVVGYSILVVFQLVTLPVEYNASSRARAALERCGIVRTEEDALGVKRMLSAAALTYVAATLQAVMQLVWFLLRAGLLGGRSSDD